MKKIYRIKTNNQEQLQRRQKETDATSRWIKIQKTRSRGLPQENKHISMDKDPNEG